MALRLIVLFFLLTSLFASTPAQALEKPTTIASLLVSDSELGRRVAQSFSSSLQTAGLEVLDNDLARAAAQGAGYPPSLNMAVSEARTFGSAVGSDFYVLIDAQTLRRSPSTGQIYFESYASIFLVSSRTGRLWKSQRLNRHAPTPGQAEGDLMKTISEARLTSPLVEDVRRAQEQERSARELAVGHEIPVIEAAPDDEERATAEGIRLPRPYRRLQPLYPESAATAEVEAVVDVLVDLDKNGEVINAEIARWAGFNLDEVTLETVRKLHFFPAMRNGTAIPLRVLLRYNFRKPPK